MVEVALVSERQHMVTSGKRNEVVNLGVVDLKGTWAFRENNRQRNAAGALFSRDAELDFHAAQDEFLYGALLTSGLGLQFTYRASGMSTVMRMKVILRYLWPMGKLLGDIPEGHSGDAAWQCEAGSKPAALEQKALPTKGHLINVF